MKYSVITHPGKKYSSNEDRYFVIDEDNLLQKEYPLFIICDGVGGRKSGEIASNFVCKHISTNLYERLSSKKINKYNCAQQLSKIIHKANENLQLLSKSSEQYNGMSTTLVLAFFFENILYVCSVGDSRIYRFYKDNLTQLNEDQSYVWHLFENGEINKEQMRTHPKNNIITMALGSDLDLAIKQYEFKFTDEDVILLCSDGLSDELSETDISKFLRLDMPLKEINEKLLEMALENGGKDNITTILIGNIK